MLDGDGLTIVANQVRQMRQAFEFERLNEHEASVFAWIISDDEIIFYTV